MNILLFSVAISALGFYVFVQPTARNIALLKRTALGCAALVLGVWVWPSGVGAVGAALLLYVALWLLGRWLLWPLHYLAALLRR
ncbi:MAG: twin-arginine translocation signal domain-containing protein [Giesbergeria sp.]|jgi:multisubunit Na+/H+ antiporter MnhG subunit|nr:twin-arginine translocation signal domain-containing protein [Giesbergeria sp.]MBP8204390.1 twin-arginine translocation signal domain-containing protein [Giesbergeria sp.]